MSTTKQRPDALTAAIDSMLGSSTPIPAETFRLLWDHVAPHDTTRAAKLIGRDEAPTDLIEEFATLRSPADLRAAFLCRPDIDPDTAAALVATETRQGVLMKVAHPRSGSADETKAAAIRAGGPHPAEVWADAARMELANLPEHAQRLVGLVRTDRCQQLMANSPDRIFYVDTVDGLRQLPADAVDEVSYLAFVEYLISVTDIGQAHQLATSPLPVIEGSFLRSRFPVDGSIHVVTDRLTRATPAITVRKQPKDKVTLEQMVAQKMLSEEMREFLVLAIRARLNILISGGSGAGKTTLARALSLHIDPHNRVCTAEEIDELGLGQHLPNVVAMTTWRTHDTDGNVTAEVTLEQLVRETLRMRPDRIWVGETRGKEAYALVKACNSGHDGSATTVHGDNGQQAVKQLIAYVMEAHLSEAAAADQVARAFHLVVQITKTSPSSRVMTEITELEPVREGSEQRRNPLWRIGARPGEWELLGYPSPRMIEAAARYGIDLNPVFDRARERSQQRHLDPPVDQQHLDRPPSFPYDAASH